MAPGTDFCLLGPLLVRSGNAVVPVRQGKQRAVLAALLLSAGKVVPLDELAEILWGPGPPPSARVTVQNYVMRLRKALADTDGSRISTQPHGYLIRVDPGELDVARFECLLGTAREAARDSSWDTAAIRSRAALSLWRGEPLSDVNSEVLAAREVPRLAELRLQALEVRIDADLHLGRQAQVIPELRQLVTGHPLRERLHGLLMLALYRDCRQGEALAAYRDARQVLVEELGAEPGRALRELHQQILAGDPALAAPDPAPPAAGAAVPRELPASVPHFTGRAGELAALTDLLDRHDELMPQTLVISAIAGMAGVGKTALAVQWAHQVAGRFPGGQLYVNLRGYDPDRPMPATDALAGFLRALGVAGQNIPPGEDERAAQYRSLLADKKVLVVLDNSGSVEQVRPLLPGSPSCAVVVTSRDSLAGLVARHGATRLEVDLLPPGEAVGLLRELIGPRVDDDPGAAAVLAAQCCRLPLALRVAAELAAARPDAPLAGLASELADQQRRLDLLDAGGDPRTAVRAVFSWSYRHLDAGARRAFRLAGLHPGADFDPYAAAALTGTGPAQARRVLDALTRAHLIQAAGPGRYGMHDLLRAYARDLAARKGKDEQDAALSRLLDHYLYTAAAAMDILYPGERHRRPRILPPGTSAPPVAEPGAARAWLDAERATLVAVTVHAAGHGWPDHATRLAATVARYLYNGCHFPEALTVSSHALDAARSTGDRAAEATAFNHIGMVNGELGRFQQAGDDFGQALTLFRVAGDRTGEARSLAFIGINGTWLGRYEQAIRHLQEALAIYRDIGDRFGEAHTLGNLGITRRLQGRSHEAAGYHQQSLDLFREISDREGEAAALAGLGTVDLRLGRYQRAAGYLQDALARFHEMGHTAGEAEILISLGEVYVGLGRYEHAAGNFKQALAIFRETGVRDLEADALNGLGDVLFHTGETDKARAHHAAALRLTSEVGLPQKQARAHSGLARAYEADGCLLQARHHWQEALARYTAIGAPEADEIRTRLAMGDGGTPAPFPL